MSSVVDLRLVSSFRVLGDELHFARAAARLNIAQPTLSQQIRRLERQLGFALFRRTSRSVELTPAGLVLHPAAGEGLDAIDDGIAAARRAAGRPGRLTLAVEFDLGDTWVDAIRAFAAAGPFRVRVVRLHEAHVLEALRDGAVDGAVHWTPHARSGLAGRMVGSLPALIAMDRAHPLADRAALTREDLAGREFVMFDREESPGLWEDYAGLLTGGRPESLAATDAPTVGASQRAMLDAVRGTGRLTLVTGDFWAAARAEDLVAVPLRPVLALPVHWSVPRPAAGDALNGLVAALRAVAPPARHG